ncbi:LIC12162 family protein [Nitrospinaceae bacterium]|nr:LIC12162 family protein [Nitrospinaceae bacterium]
MFLVTTANQKYWKTDEKILFLGEWCKMYREKHIWSNLDHETLPPHWDKYQQLNSHRTYLEEIFEKYLKVFASNLNNCHNEDHSLRYWRIIIGPWLKMFIDVVYDRYLSIKSTIDYAVTNTWIPNLNPALWVPVGSTAFHWGCMSSHNFNLYLYARLIKKLGKISFEFKDDELFFDPLYIPELKALALSDNLKNNKRDLVSKLLKLIPDRFHKIVFCSTGLSFGNNLKLIFSLGQAPFMSPCIAPCRTPIKENLRKNLKVPEETDEFESILNDLVAEQLPISFFEGYLAMRSKSLKAYPKATKAIFTSNKMTTAPDEAFRFWVADRVEKGAKLILTQHGGGYGLFSSFSEKHELEICDKFFSWGWGGEQPKVSPMTSTKLQSSRYNIRSDPGGTILLVTASSPLFDVRFDHVAGGGLGLNRFLQVKRFLNFVCPEAYKLLLARLLSFDYGWNEKKRLADICPSLQVYEGEASMTEQLRRSRLCIHNYFGTTWLETLSMNFPTVVFWDSNMVHTLASVQPYLDDLRRLKILHDTPESAAEFVNEIYEDPLAWWMSLETQQVKDKFCYLFARTSKNWLKEWKEELLKNG